MKTTKRIGQKLRLNKETLRNLSEREMEGAVGGSLGPRVSLWDSCRICDTSSPDCTQVTVNESCSFRVCA